MVRVGPGDSTAQGGVWPRPPTAPGSTHSGTPRPSAPPGGLRAVGLCASTALVAPLESWGHRPGGQGAPPGSSDSRWTGWRPAPVPPTGAPGPQQALWPRPLSPGLLVAYCHRFDIQVQSSRVYFVACTIGESAHPCAQGPGPRPLPPQAHGALAPSCLLADSCLARLVPGGACVWKTPEGPMLVRKLRLPLAGPRVPRWWRFLPVWFPELCCVCPCPQHPCGGGWGAWGPGRGNVLPSPSFQPTASASW